MTRKRGKSDLIDFKERKSNKKIKNCDDSENKSMSSNFSRTENDDFEIIKLTEINYHDNNSSNSDDNNSEWEEVPELPTSNGVIIDINSVESEDEEKYNKRQQLISKRKHNSLIERTMIMALVSRVIFVNKCCSDVFIQNLALSHFPIDFLNQYRHKIKFDEINKLLRLIKSKFSINDECSELGNVRVLLKKSLEEKKLTLSWLNVVLLTVLRSGGLRGRLIGVLYPKNVDNNRIICEPTTYRASTRGKTRKKIDKKNNNRKTPSFSFTKMQSIIFLVEIFDEEHNRWIAVDFRNMSAVDNVADIVEDLPRFFYVISVDNGGVVKDVTARYDSNWAESSRRSRLARDSWERIIAPFSSKKLTFVDSLEENEVKTQLLSRGIPKTIADLKGHPIFVLRKHLLKYEVIHPPDVQPFGQFNKEDVYLRDNVKLAHTRETWLKEAMVVKDGEIPCKRVKTMMASRKQKTHGTDPYVDIFGPWQIEKFVPPKAENGIVPVNSHGNVNLFQACMIPEGCIHIRMHGIDKVAKRLNIDYAPAMIGWGFVKGHRAVPILDGWVVCKENIRMLKDGLIEWNRFQAIKRAEEREKLVVKRWQVLTRRILLKERLRIEYKF